MRMTAWFDHLEESYSFKEVKFKTTCPLVKQVALLLKTLMKPLVYGNGVSEIVTLSASKAGDIELKERSIVFPLHSLIFKYLILDLCHLPHPNVTLDNVVVLFQKLDF